MSARQAENYPVLRFRGYVRGADGFWRKVVVFGETATRITRNQRGQIVRTETLDECQFQQSVAFEQATPG